MKKQILRMCIVTREKLEKKDLVRIVKDNNGNIFIDNTQKANGHGCYIKNEKNVIEMAKNKKILDRVFETVVNEEIYEELLKD